MSEIFQEAAMSRVVDGYFQPGGEGFILRFNRPDGRTDYVVFPRGDVAVLADIAALGVRRQVSAVDPTVEGALATSFDLAEIPGADTIVVNFNRGAQPSAPIALPKSVAMRLMQSFQKLLPMIGGSGRVQ